MANCVNQLDQLMNDNDNTAGVIQTYSELLKLLHCEWIRIRCQNVASSPRGRTRPTDELDTAAGLKSDLDSLTRLLLQSVRRIADKLLDYPVDLQKSVSGKIENLFDLDHELGFLRRLTRRRVARRAVSPGASASERLIGTHYSLLLAKLDAFSVADEMFERNVISKGQLDSIRAQRGKMVRASEHLLHLVMIDPTPSMYNAFKDALIKTHQDEIYKALEGSGQ